MQKRRMQKKSKWYHHKYFQMLTGSISKIKKSVQPRITFIVNVVSENGIIFSGWAYTLRLE